MFSLLEKSWQKRLKNEIASDVAIKLSQFLETERERGVSVYPPEPLIFNAFSQVPYDQVKVVIMGQDPYHGPGQAHGLSFSVPCGIRPPPSLQNIFREIKNDLGIEPPKHGCLNSWSSQGVLLLNATLTVRAKEAKSHYGMGWEWFTDMVVESLFKREDPIVFVLWGKTAQEKCLRFFQNKNSHHALLIAPHPSPFSAHTGFLGCRHFSKINNYLKEWNKEPINWAL